MSGGNVAATAAAAALAGMTALFHGFDKSSLSHLCTALGVTTLPKDGKFDLINKLLASPPLKSACDGPPENAKNFLAQHFTPEWRNTTGLVALMNGQTMTDAQLIAAFVDRNFTSSPVSMSPSSSPPPPPHHHLLLLLSFPL